MEPHSRNRIPRHGESTIPNDQQKELAIYIANLATPQEKEALAVWINKLLEIKKSDLSLIEQAKNAVSLTAQSSVVLPTLKLIAREGKRLAWDDRGLQGKMGLGGAAIGLALFGTQGAGIAALGTAMGVPLWVVFGAGAAFLGVLYEEITRMRPETQEGDTVAQGKVSNLSSPTSESTPKLIPSEQEVIDVEILDA
ncbi:hypothetical protein [Cyanobium sp. LEGE 06113]|uniref:hypothetical protein n=1 Tax=Cyanobium sp. LEGE 06113 TaxID=1297573 RepID=UPI00187E6B4A|nr:hypothetical protein [Cyanobium sp. LEGE 06113]MBE9153635.1 hypothetical protein [Cyanobium sp. LEGE 06113]